MWHNITIDHTLLYDFACSTIWEKAVETNSATPQAVVSGLVEGNEYQFRVIAVNKAGQSEPGEASKNFIAKPRFCEYSYLFFVLITSF